MIVDEITVDDHGMHVSSITQVIDHPDCKIYSIDLNSKYVEILGAGGGDDREGFELTIFPGEHTLKADGPDSYARIKFPAFGEGWWHAHLDTGRYSVYVVLYQVNRDTARVAWVNDEEWADSIEAIVDDNPAPTNG